MVERLGVKPWVQLSCLEACVGRANEFKVVGSREPFIMKNWTLSRRLTGTITLLIVLMLVSQVITWFVERHYISAQSLANTRRDSLLLTTARLRYDMLIMSDSMKALMLFPDDDTERNRKLAADNDLIKAGEEMRDLLKEDRELLRYLDEIRSFDSKTLDTLENRIMDLAKKDSVEAHRVYRNEYLPAREKQDGLAIAFAIQVQHRAAGELKNVRSAQLVGFGAILFIVAVSVGLGRSLHESIQTPLAELVSAMNRMRLGDFTVRLKAHRGDEFGELAEGLNRTCDELGALVGQVQKAGIQVNTSLTEISATAREQQATANEIAATTTEIGATAKEIAATSTELQRTVNEVAKVADQTAVLANSGQGGLARMEQTIRQIMDAGSAITSKLDVLNEKAANINQVVATITKVADQTNLLSLNAAIEAEKAGEYGRGFAVVATEIRRLADQTAVATYDIEQTVKEMQSAVAAGVMGMDKFSDEVRRGVAEVQQVGGQLGEIIHQVQTLTPRFDLVSEGMQAQTTGARQTSEALSQLGEAGQQIAEAAHQSNAAIEQLTQAVERLRDGIAKFKLA